MEKHDSDHVRQKSSYSLCENMFITFIITFAAAATFFEGYMPESFVKIYRFFMCFACVVTWLWTSFSGGAREKWRFLIYTVIFWLLPFAVTFLSNDGPEFCRMSLTLYSLSEFFGMMFITPAEQIGSSLNMGAVPVILILMLICVFAFLAGNFMSEKLKKGNYAFIKC